MQCNRHGVDSEQSTIFAFALCVCWGGGVTDETVGADPNGNRVKVDKPHVVSLSTLHTELIWT